MKFIDLLYDLHVYSIACKLCTSQYKFRYSRVDLRYTIFQDKYTNSILVYTSDKQLCQGMYFIYFISM